MIDAGVLDRIGVRYLQIPTPRDPTLAGVAPVAQGVVFDGASPNGLFRAISPWIDSGETNPNYEPAILAASTPAGTRVQVVFRGIFDPQGAQATIWSLNPDVADGRRFLQYWVVLEAGLDGATPSLDTLVVPLR